MPAVFSATWGLFQDSKNKMNQVHTQPEAMTVKATRLQLKAVRKKNDYICMKLTD